MLILVTTFVQLFKMLTQSFVCLNERFLLLLPQHKIALFSTWTTAKNFLSYSHIERNSFFNLAVVAILLLKKQQFYRFESVLDLVSFINFNFFSFSFVRNLFLLLRLELFLICS